MSGAIPPLPQYAFMAWCSVKEQGQLYLYIYLYLYVYNIKLIFKLAEVSNYMLGFDSPEFAETLFLTTLASVMLNMQNFLPGYLKKCNNLPEWLIIS
jgi:hypothetical protein